MAAKKKTKTSLRSAKIEANVLHLLYYNVSYAGWENDLALEKCFYIRGVLWLRRELAKVRFGITKVDASFVERKRKIIESRKNWHIPGFDWDEPFSPRQLIDAVSPMTRATLSYKKAVEVLVVCEAILDYLHELHPEVAAGHMVYERMWVEAAASYINRLTPAILERAVLKGKTFSGATAQPHRADGTRGFSGTWRKTPETRSWKATP